MNKRIRNAISNYVSIYGPTDSRIIIRKFAHHFNTSKQRIAGNISYMVCVNKTLNIIRNKPNSVLY